MLLCLLRMHAINSCVPDVRHRLRRGDFTHNGKQVVNRLKIPQGLSTLMFRRWREVSSRGGVSAVIHRKKNRPVFSLGWNLLRSSSSQVLSGSVLFSILYSPFSSKHFFLGLLLRSLSTHLFFLVVVLLLVLSMTAFSYEHFIAEVFHQTVCP